MKINKLTQGILLTGLVSLGFTSSAFAYNQITSTLDFGATGSNVTNVQTYLASNSSFYPEGLVTGYYGSLTRTAVQRFQAYYGIVSSGSPSTTGYGRVGPSTLAKLNELIAGGTVSQGDISGPTFYNVVSAPSTSYATMTFNTNEATNARVVYGTSPLMFNEGDINSNSFGPMNGSSVNSTSGMNTSHSITIPNLQTNTIYYYTVIATDAAGNASIIGPNSTFRTF